MTKNFSLEEAFALEESVRVAFWISFEQISGRGKYNFDTDQFDKVKE